MRRRVEQHQESRWLASRRERSNVGHWRAASQILCIAIVRFSFSVVHVQPGQFDTSTQETLIERK